MSYKSRNKSYNKEHHVWFRRIMLYSWLLIIFAIVYFYFSAKMGGLGVLDWLVSLTGLPVSLVAVFLIVFIIVFCFATFIYLIVVSSEINERNKAKAALEREASHIKK